ncbi:MAG: hypothetical protein NC102_10095 [Clostridium sp.]|nr:hypothetical protein [Clostridium sp.]
MIIIALCIGDRAEWALVDGKEIVEYATTDGVNPFFMTRREMSHAIRLGLPESFFRRRWDAVYFYGSGCANEDKNKIVEGSLIAQFRSPAYVGSDLLGVARGIFGRKAGLLCLLAQGANSGFFDGNAIVKNVMSGGYILGDEGSMVHLAKNLVSDVIKGIAPHDIVEDFLRTYETTPAEIMNEVYESQGRINAALGRYAGYLEENISHDYCHKLVYDAFISFFERNVAQYDYKAYGISVAGIAVERFREVFLKAADDFGVRVDKIDASPLTGLVDFHFERSQA